MEAQANRRTVELNAESACEGLRPEAQAIHTKKAPELPTQAKWQRTMRCTALTAVGANSTSLSAASRILPRGRRAWTSRLDCQWCLSITSSWKAR